MKPKPIKFDYIDGAGTLQWVDASSKVGYIRFHRDEKRMPGPTLYTLVVEVYADHTYECKLLSASKNGRGPTREELERLDAYMQTLGYTGMWRRAKGDGTLKTIRLK